MNKLFIVSMFALLTFVACDVLGEKVKGNGNVVTKTHEVDSFSSLKIETVCKVEITQSEEEKVIVEADENLHEYIEIEHRGDQLKVRTEEKVNFNGFKKLVVKIYVKHIDELDVASVGNVVCTNEIKSENIDLDVSSVGNTELRFDVKTLDGDFNTVGRLLIEGTADKATVDNSSVGGVNMGDFKVKVLNIENSSVGGIEVYASDEIYVDHSGIGGLKYGGNPEKKEIKDSGLGKVKQL